MAPKKLYMATMHESVALVSNSCSDGLNAEISKNEYDRANTKSLCPIITAYVHQKTLAYYIIHSSSG